VPVDSVLPLALRAADRAIGLDSTLASAFAARANLLSAAWRWDEAEADLRRAIALDPGDPTAHQWLGENLLIRGKVAEAVAALGSAAALDSLAPIILASHAVALGIAGDIDAAIRLSRHAVGWILLIFFLSALGVPRRPPHGRHRAARTMIRGSPGRRRTGLLGYAYGVSGRADDARALLAQATSQPTGATPRPSRIHLGLGDLGVPDVTIAPPVAERSSRASPWRRPSSIPAREPRFAALLRRVGFDPLLARAAQASAARGGVAGGTWATTRSG
jgi:tetratricopeptide (TPR) repeat protein